MLAGRCRTVCAPPRPRACSVCAIPQSRADNHATRWNIYVRRRPLGVRLNSTSPKRRWGAYFSKVVKSPGLVDQSRNLNQHNQANGKPQDSGYRESTAKAQGSKPGPPSSTDVNRKAGAARTTNNGSDNSQTKPIAGLRANDLEMIYGIRISTSTRRRSNVQPGGTTKPAHKEMIRGDARVVEESGATAARATNRRTMRNIIKAAKKEGKAAEANAMEEILAPAPKGGEAWQARQVAEEELKSAEREPEAAKSKALDEMLASAAKAPEADDARQARQAKNQAKELKEAIEAQIKWRERRNAGDRERKEAKLQQQAAREMALVKELAAIPVVKKELRATSRLQEKGKAQTQRQKQEKGERKESTNVQGRKQKLFRKRELIARTRAEELVKLPVQLSERDTDGRPPVAMASTKVVQIQPLQEDGASQPGTSQADEEEKILELSSEGRRHMEAQANKMESGSEEEKQMVRELQARQTEEKVRRARAAKACELEKLAVTDTVQVTKALPAVEKVIRRTARKSARQKAKRQQERAQTSLAARLARESKAGNADTPSVNEARLPARTDAQTGASREARAAMTEKTRQDKREEAEAEARTEEGVKTAREREATKLKQLGETDKTKIADALLAVERAVRKTARQEAHRSEERRGLPQMPSAVETQQNGQQRMELARTEEGRGDGEKQVDQALLGAKEAAKRKEKQPRRRMAAKLARQAAVSAVSLVARDSARGTAAQPSFISRARRLLETLVDDDFVGKTRAERGLLNAVNDERKRVRNATKQQEARRDEHAARGRDLNRWPELYERLQAIREGKDTFGYGQPQLLQRGKPAILPMPNVSYSFDRNLIRFFDLVDLVARGENVAVHTGHMAKDGDHARWILMSKSMAEWHIKNYLDWEEQIINPRQGIERPHRETGDRRINLSKLPVFEWDKFRSRLPPPSVKEAAYFDELAEALDVVYGHQGATPENAAYVWIHMPLGLLPIVKSVVTKIRVHKLVAQFEEAAAEDTSDPRETELQTLQMIISKTEDTIDEAWQHFYQKTHAADQGLKVMRDRISAIEAERKAERK